MTIKTWLKDNKPIWITVLILKVFVAFNSRSRTGFDTSGYILGIVMIIMGLALILTGFGIIPGIGLTLFGVAFIIGVTTIVTMIQSLGIWAYVIGGVLLLAFIGGKRR